jgi:hypothetical protein
MSDLNYFQMVIDSTGGIISTPISNDNHWTSMCSNGNTIVAVADSGLLRSKISYNQGVNWSQNVTSNDSNSWSSVCYDTFHGLFVAVAKEGTNKIMTSSDGILWSEHTSPHEDTTYNTWTSICCDASGHLVAVADSGFNTVMISSNPASSGSWSLHPTPNDSGQWKSVVAGSGGMFLAVGSVSSMLSTDYGTTWSITSNNNENSTICYDASNNTFVTYSEPPITSETSIPFEFTKSQITYNNGTPTLTWKIVPSTLSCYNIGTPILCYINGMEMYVPIENIKIGTLVKTLTQGYKPVELIGKHNIINNPESQLTSMHKMKGSNLILSGYHYLLVDELRDDLIHNKTDVTDWFYKHYATTIEGKYPLLVCNSDLFEPIINASIYTIMHLVLESDDIDDRFGIYADYILSESTSKKKFLRHNFQNMG